MRHTLYDTRLVKILRKLKKKDHVRFEATIKKITQI